ncbi:MAG: S-methyl-5-thioribose-1-phosphate isomerase [Elusimicrobia bacterium CG_4_10_14_0_2_um_filter_56_8]|nr:MAG: S-methyl-5-thioribose-1-phosphate isomerase [Elusimicrobia bacterium CG1_02_56_21]PJA14380.1 MAG: S-methyl-5-thioribose-1-phosphate isomerase [Elusimicrobia bacterium CG_4_10_14_0_2_um_filter_56_8]
MIPPRLIFKKGVLKILDQRLLPDKIKFIPVRDAAGTAKATKDMALRGAPLIGCAAAFGFALEIRRIRPSSSSQLERLARRTALLLKASRPTAVALFYAADRMLHKALVFAAANPGKFSPAATGKLLNLIDGEARLVTAEDQTACLAMGNFGAALLPKNCVIMTYCNAGALATMGIGTAVGVITAAHEAGKIKHAYSCETRPYMQGARLTIWELMRGGVPSELLTDNMAAHIIKTCGVNAIVVGADRIASNGDTANKIGTYGLAVIARHHKVPFYVAAPTPTIDGKARDGGAIVIEERSAEEVAFVKGSRIAPRGVKVRHPAFDVTPASLITALITEKGVISPVTRANINKNLSK